MTTYDDWAEYADVDYPTREEEKAAEIALDIADEERAAEEQEKADAAEDQLGDDDECAAELIDGAYTYCGCPECEQREADDRAQYEADHGFAEGVWS